MPSVSLNSLLLILLGLSLSSISSCQSTGPIKVYTLDKDGLYYEDKPVNIELLERVYCVDKISLAIILSELQSCREQ